MADILSRLQYVNSPFNQIGTALYTTTKNRVKYLNLAAFLVSIVALDFTNDDTAMV